MSARTIHQCPACEQSYATRELARSCSCPDRTIEKWECASCRNWWEPKWRMACCGVGRDDATESTEAA